MEYHVMNFGERLLCDPFSAFFINQTEKTKMAIYTSWRLVDIMQDMFISGTNCRISAHKKG